MKRDCLHLQDKKDKKAKKREEKTKKRDKDRTCFLHEHDEQKFLVIALCCRPRRTIHIPCCLLTVYIQPDQIRSEKCCNCDTGQARQKGEEA